MSIGKVASTEIYNTLVNSHENIVKPILAGAISDFRPFLFNLFIISGTAAVGLTLAKKAHHLQEPNRNIFEEGSGRVGYLAKKTMLYTGAAICLMISAYEIYTTISEIHFIGSTLIEQRKTAIEEADRAAKIAFEEADRAAKIALKEREERMQCFRWQNKLCYTKEVTPDKWNDKLERAFEVACNKFFRKLDCRGYIPAIDMMTRSRSIAVD